MGERTNNTKISVFLMLLAIEIMWIAMGIVFISYDIIFGGVACVVVTIICIVFQILDFIKYRNDDKAHNNLGVLMLPLILVGNLFGLLACLIFVFEHFKYKKEQKRKEEEFSLQEEK